MNFHDDEFILNGVKAHYKEICDRFSYKNHVVGIFLQGSQNYGLDYENSDIDTKFIITPTLDDLVYNVQPASFTHVRSNNEHTDVKDIRLYMRTFEKQNINFVEILFTKYCLIDDLYKDNWDILIENRELIAHYSPGIAVKCMCGMAHEKYAALTHEYPSKLGILSQFGYDPKQLHHIIRLYSFMRRYIAGESYENCLYPKDEKEERYLRNIKSGVLSLEQAQFTANLYIDDIDDLKNTYILTHGIVYNDEALSVLNHVQHDIMVKSIVNELGV